MKTTTAAERTGAARCAGAAQRAGWTLLAALVLAAPTFGYEVVEVTNGGTIMGTVTLSGPVPDDPVLEISVDVEHCGVTQPGGMYLVGPEGEVQNVLLVITDVDKGNAVPAKSMTTIDNLNCAFDPLVGIAYVGGYFVCTNNDPILHNTHLTLRTDRGGRTITNLALPKQGMEIRKAVRRPGLVEVTCDLHSWMRGFIYASEHPYVAVTGEDGLFEIPGLLPGEYSLWVWHEGLGEQTLPVQVSGGETTSVSIVYKSE